jgi:hypothetical protein
MRHPPYIFVRAIYTVKVPPVPTVSPPRRSDHDREDKVPPVRMGTVPPNRPRPTRNVIVAPEEASADTQGSSASARKLSQNEAKLRGEQVAAQIRAEHVQAQVAQAHAAVALAKKALARTESTLLRAKQAKAHSLQVWTNLKKALADHEDMAQRLAERAGHAVRRRHSASDDAHQTTVERFTAHATDAQSKADATRDELRRLHRKYKLAAEWEASATEAHDAAQTAVDKARQHQLFVALDTPEGQHQQKLERANRRAKVSAAKAAAVKLALEQAQARVEAINAEVANATRVLAAAKSEMALTSDVRKFAAAQTQEIRARMTKTKAMYDKVLTAARSAQFQVAKLESQIHENPEVC